MATGVSASNTQLSQMERRFSSRIKLSEFFSQDSKLGKVSEGQYIQVRVVWNSGVKTCTLNSLDGGTRSFQECNYIFSDESGHIAARHSFRKGDVNGSNIAQLLKSANQIYRISGFSVVSLPYDPLTLESNYILRMQHKRLGLGDVSRDIFPIKTNDSIESFPICLSYIPCDLTEFMDMEQMVVWSSVDCVGYVENVEDHQKEKDDTSFLQYQRIRIKSSVENDEGFCRDIALFDEHIGKVKKDTVYLLSNLKVGLFRGNVSLKTSFRSIIIEVNANNLRNVLPPKYHKSSLVNSLFPGSLSQEEVEALIEVESDQSCLENTSAAKRQSLESVGDGEEENIESSDAEVTYDFKINKKPLVVNVIPSTKYMDVGKDVYSMRSKQRGVALIILNSIFPKDSPDKIERRGGTHDAKYLKEFLTQCGEFYVDMKTNVKSTDLDNVIDTFKKDVKQEFKAADVCIVAVFSHGSFGSIKMVDGVHINLHDDVIFQFDDHKFPMMKGKPKIMILQVCQSFSDRRPLPSSKSEHQRNKGGLKDMVACYPTSPGSTVKRNINVGSHFILRTG